MEILRAVLGLAFLLCLNQCYAAKYFIAAPNMLRVDVEETVSISVFDVNVDVDIHLSLQDYPHRNKTFSQVSGKFRQQQPGLLKIKVNARDLYYHKSLDKQYVYFKASSNTPELQFNDEIRILVSYRNSMVFIRTDKPIYNPGQTVNIRVVPLGLDLRPSMNNVAIEILNPQGICVKKWNNLNTNEGFFSCFLDLTENALLGEWTTSALYGHGLVQNASIKFEVREYVLPTFSVKIEGPDYILERDATISVKIKSKYTYGKPVLGSVRVNLAVLDDAGKTERFSYSIMQLSDGESIVTVSTDLLKNHTKILWFPAGKRLFIQAKVIEQATGQQEEAYDKSIYFTNSPLEFSFRRTQKYFKPGVPFEIKVDIFYVNGQPAKAIDLEIDAKTDDGKQLIERLQDRVDANTDTTDQLGRASFVVDVPGKFRIRHLDIKVSAKIKHGGKNIISNATFKPRMYRSSGNNYLFVRVPKCKVGDAVNADAFILQSSGIPTSLTYLVIAHGQVVSQGTIARHLGVVTSIRFRVTSAMSPQARFVAYCYVNNELIVDSTIMEVEEKLPNQVKFLGDQQSQKLPGTTFKIKIQSSPYSRVGILAVDQSVYLLRNDKHLTRNEVFKRMQSHDLGCGSGAGYNNEDVLRRGGLAVMTSIDNLYSYPRTDYSCAANARRKRRNAPKADPQCCLFGKIINASTCLVRAKEFLKSNLSLAFNPRDICVEEYYKCCVKKFEMDVRRRSNDVHIPNNLFDELSFDELEVKHSLDQMQFRTSFPERWLFEDELASKDGRITFSVTAPDTITTWVMQAIAVSNTTGFGLTPPFNLKIFREFFVSIKLPYSAQRGEQVSVIATVFNYQSNPGKVRVFLTKGRHFCTYSESGSGAAAYTVDVEANGATSFAFPIVPTDVGNVPIEVRIVAASSVADGERRILKVLPEGMERQETHSVILDPLDVLRDPTAVKSSTSVTPTTPSKLQTSTRGNGAQKNQLSINFPESTVPESEYAMLTVIGNLIGSAVPNIIEGQGLDSMIKLPSGCGEQTMKNLAPIVFILQYLKSTKKVTPQIEKTVLDFIQSGYQNELNYRRGDHSFSAFLSVPGSTWLTAFVVRTFCTIQKLGGIEIDQNVITTAMNWLASQQRADGAIPERHPVRYIRDVINSDITITAYVVTAFLECQSFTQNSVQTVKKAVAYLENMQPNVNRIYVKAVVAYALALASSPKRFKANQDLLNTSLYDAGRNTRYWHDGQGRHAIDVEGTSYALLTQLVLGRRGYAGPIVIWLTEQQKGGGGFTSTQDTCVALQALAYYSEATADDQLNLQIDITNNRGYKRTLIINQKNALVQQQLDITNWIGDELLIETKGSGVALLQVETRYNTPSTELETCQFDLNVTTIERQKRQYDQPILIVPKSKKKKVSKSNKRRKCKRKRCSRKKTQKCRGRRCKARERKRRRKPKPKPTTPTSIVTTRPLLNDGPVTNSISIKICTKYKKAGESAGMSIIDVGILTGFSAVEDSLKELRDKVQPGIAKFEISDRHVVLYLDKIPSTHGLCFNLELKRDFEVGIVQPVPVTVYDYYEPDNRCTKYYGPKAGSRLNLATCKHHTCECVSDKCTSCRPSNNADIVVNDLCTKYDYAFRGKLIAIDEKGKWLHLTFDIVELFRPSKTKKITKATKRVKFAKNANCDCPIVAGKVDSYFLIMGIDDGLQGSSKVKMGENMFVKEMPNKGPGSKFFKTFRATLTKDRCN